MKFLVVHDGAYTPIFLAPLHMWPKDQRENGPWFMGRELGLGVGTVWELQLSDRLKKAGLYLCKEKWDEYTHLPLDPYEWTIIDIDFTEL